MQVNPERLAARERRRRVIFNNDGCDCWYRPRASARTDPADVLLDARTSELANSQVDTLFYCTNRSGVGVFSHQTAIGEIFTRRDDRYVDNLVPDLLARGTDPLRLMIAWGRQHDREVFWSLRMNDTHDGWGEPGNFTDDRHYGISAFRRAHPEYLLGGTGRKPKYGLWTALNYALAPVREFIFRMIEEVCRNYDVDGIECDFLRHETFFPSTAAGEPCTDAERAAMTGLLRRVRTLLDEVSVSRGKPLLLAVRTPDSADLAHDLGLDLRGWMAEGLVDLLAVSCYYRLTPWAETVELGRRHGVPVFACLSDSRLKLPSGTPDPLRQTVESLRGRALTAWQEGVAGIHMFNLFDPRCPFWREAGDVADLSRLNRVHLVSARGTGGSMWRVPRVHHYRRLPLLAPEYVPGCVLHVRGELTEVPIHAGGCLDRAQGIELRMRMGNLEDPAQVAARWNGRWLPPGEWRDGHLRWTLAPAEVRPLDNRAGLVLTGAAGPFWEDLQLWVAAQGTVAEMEAGLMPVLDN
jgi:hypothetical protein